MILNDHDILALCSYKEGYNNLINPCVNHTRQKVRVSTTGEQKSTTPVVSYGLDSCGYSLRLSGPYKVFVNDYDEKEYTPISPLNVPEKYIKELEFDGKPKFAIPPGGLVLAKTLEYIKMPNNIMAEIKDKSRYARLGISVMNTIVQPGWQGHITLEIVNNNPSHWVELIEGQGIAQIIFNKLSGEVTFNHHELGGNTNAKTTEVIPGSNKI